MEYVLVGWGRIQLDFKLWHLLLIYKKKKFKCCQHEKQTLKSLISLFKVHPHFIMLFLILCICKAFRLDYVLTSSFPLSNTNQYISSLKDDTLSRSKHDFSPVRREINSWRKECSSQDLKQQCMQNISWWHFVLLQNVGSAAPIICVLEINLYTGASSILY